MNSTTYKKEVYVFEQGYSLHSPSEILVKLATDSKNKIEKGLCWWQRLLL